MITLLIAARRRAGMTRTEFQQYVKQVHAPMVLQDPDAAGLILSYTQNHIYDAAYGAGPGQPYPAVSERDIITEVGFAGMEQLGQARHTPMFVDVIQPDEDNFVDQRTALAFPTRADPQANSQTHAARFKLIQYLRLTDDRAAEESAQAWQIGHAATLAADPALHLAGYVQRHALVSPQAPASAPRYAVGMLWFAEQAQTALFHGYHRQLLAQPDSPFDPAESFCVFAEEFVLKGLPS